MTSARKSPEFVSVIPQAYSVLLPLAPWELPEVVAAALDSLARQTWPPSQLVVSVDGALPRELQVVLKGYPFSLDSIEGPGCEGVGPVLNRGLHHCVYEWVVRADADDLSFPQRCEIQLTHLLQNPDLVVLGSAISEFVDDPDQPLAVRQVPLSWKEINRLSRWRNPMNHPSVVIRRSVLEAVGGYWNLPGFEDYELWLRLLFRGFKLGNVGMPLVAARVGQAHLSRRRGWLYVVKECRFLFFCWRSHYFSAGRMLLLMLLRIPVRLIPAPLLAWVMLHGLRSLKTRRGKP